MTQCAKMIVGFMQMLATFLSNVYFLFFHVFMFFFNFYLNVYYIYAVSYGKESWMIQRPQKNPIASFFGHGQPLREIAFNTAWYESYLVVGGNYMQQARERLLVVTARCHPPCWLASSRSRPRSSALNSTGQLLRKHERPNPRRSVQICWTGASDQRTFTGSDWQR